MKHFWHLLLYCLAVSFCCWLIGFVCFCIYAFSLQTDLSTKQEAVVVLTGGSKRIDTAIKLLKEQDADHLLISGVNKKVSAKKLLKNVPPSLKNKITLGYEAENTVGNAKEINNWIKNKNIHSVLLVTSFYHMPRSVFEINRKNKTLKIASMPVFPTEFNNSVNWIKTRYAWLLFIEYHKFVFVNLKHWLNFGG